MEEAFTEKERITGLSDEELGPDLLALLGLQEQGWMNGLAPPPVGEDVRVELPMLEPLQPQHGSRVSTGQSSALTSLSCTPALITPLDDTYTLATEFEDILPTTSRK